MRYVQGRTSVENPAEWPRGPDDTSAASSAQVAASGAYSDQRARAASFHEPNANVRSYTSTMSGAVIIDSLQPMPSADAPTATACQKVRCSTASARTLA